MPIFLNNLIDLTACFLGSAFVLIIFYPWLGRRVSALAWRQLPPSIFRFHLIPRLDHIPAVGSTSPILSFIGAFKYLFNAREMIQQGAEKYPIFRVPNLDKWMVIARRSDYIEDIRRASEAKLSFLDEAEESFLTSLTFGPNVVANPYHIRILRTQFTRKLDALFQSLHNEVVHATNELIPSHGDDWIKLKVVPVMSKITGRASNRVLVGAPLCRNMDYVDVNIQFTLQLLSTASLSRVLPAFLKRIVISMTLSSLVERGVKHLRPVIEARRGRMADDGNDYPDKPDDLLARMMDEAQGEEISVHNLTRRMLGINVGALHSTSMTISHALYHLAEHPEHFQSLREEIEEIVYREGWTHAAISKMVKVDSFIKETQRLNPLQIVNVRRIVREPFTFSDGTYLPEGTLVAVAAHSVHMDKSNYPDPTSFQPFRFVDKTRDENAGRKVGLTDIHADWMAFGYGRRACPGRFFAADILKLLLAHIIVNYDMKLDGSRPENLWVMTMCVPNLQGEVFFRKRLEPHY